MKKFASLGLGLLLALGNAFGEEVRLDDMSTESATQGWGALQTGKSVGGRPLSIAGKSFAHGLGTHANSEVVYELDGGYDTFAAQVGVDDEMKGHKDSSVVFQVFGDGKKLFDSGVMRLNDPARQVKVSVAGVSVLKLVVTDAGDGISCDHADWAEAVLLGGKTAATAKPAKYTVASRSLTIKLTEDGELTGALRGGTRLVGCRAEGSVAVKELPGGGYAFTRTVADAKAHRCLVTDRFTPAKDSIRWEVELVSDGVPWSTAIETRLKYPATADSRFWTSWGHPDNRTGVWQDPMVWQPFASRTWYYQFANYTEMGGKALSCICIPLLTVAEPKNDTALTLVQSPEDTLLDLTLRESAAGDIRLSRANYRLGEGRAVRFAMDLVSHPADTRAGLGWMVNRYPDFFNPPNPSVDAMAGCGAYSGNEEHFDAAKLRRMAFRINWKCSEDFPYMGLFLPPVPDAQTRWTRAPDERTPGKPAWTSLQTLNEYSRWMHADGFHVLNYFNVTEYGRNMQYPPPPRKAKSDDELWKDPHDYLFHGGLRSAVLMNGQQPVRSNCYGALIVDPGDGGYQKHLLEQARRHIDNLPDSDGICIDRTDWLGCYNRNADDGVSWVEGKPARSLFVSWSDLMSKLGPLMHQAGKVVFVNNCTVRIETLRHVDGIYAEWTWDGAEPYLNYSALEGLRKPVSIWTPDEGTLRKHGADEYLQRCLYLGVYPTAPYPNNNHCLRPSAYADEAFLAYGPLLDAMRGRKWVLQPHCIETATPGVKVNLFQVPGGYVVPVTFGDKAQTAAIRIRNVPGIPKARWEVLHPGVDAPLPAKPSVNADTHELTVPLKRGCAMVKILLAEPGPP